VPLSMKDWEAALIVIISSIITLISFIIFHPHDPKAILIIGAITYIVSLNIILNVVMWLHE
jgi:Kef-type K+ transport system membrane component KefB